MVNLWDYFKDFFREAENSSPSRPIFNEVLERSDEEKAAYENWKDSLPCRRLFDLLAAQYAIYQSNPAGVDPAVTFLQSGSSNGFALHLDLLDFTRQDASHFLDLLREKMLVMTYRPQLSNVRTWSEKDWVQAVERHFLQPKKIWEEGKVTDQFFGNVTIELTLRNDRPHLLTFRATAYADRLYAPARNFHELMQAIRA